MKNKTLKDILEVLELNLLSNKRKNSSKILNDVEEEIINLYNSNHIKLDYKGKKNCGQIAKEHNITVGEIGCKKCGAGHSGGLTKNTCVWCGEKYLDDTFYLTEDYKPTEERIVLGFEEDNKFPVACFYDEGSEEWIDEKGNERKIYEWIELPKKSEFNDI